MIKRSVLLHNSINVRTIFWRVYRNNGSELMFNKFMSGSSGSHRVPPHELKEECFSNLDTWKLAVWFEMNQPMKKMVRQTSYYLGAPEISRWCHKLWASGETPAAIILQRVDWIELDALWSAESQRLFAETQKLIDYHAFKEWHEC